MSRKIQQNKLTSPELLAQVNPHNQHLMNDFLQYMRSIQRSVRTCEAYRHDLCLFFVWVLQHADNKPFYQITKRDITAYQGYLLEENKNSPTRVRRIKSTISSLSNYAENMLDDEPEYKGFRSIVRKVENPPLYHVQDKTVLKDYQVQKLLTMLMNRGKYEQACAAALAFYSGRRKSELARFKVSDFTDEHLVCDGALYKSDPIQTKGRGKGKFINCYTLVKQFKPYLDAWLKYREENGIETEWLLPDPDIHSAQVSQATMNSWAKTFTKLLGLDFYWHACRHYYTTFLVRAGLPDSVITEIVGWESPEMVKVYNDLGAEEQISAWFRGGEPLKAEESITL